MEKSKFCMTVRDMFIKAPYNKRFHKEITSQCKVLWHKGNSVMYEAITDVRITSADLGMGSRDFSRFCKAIEVEGGRKIRRGTLLILKPYRNKTFFIRLSEDELARLKEYAAEKGQTVSATLREIIDSILLHVWRENGAI